MNLTLRFEPFALATINEEKPFILMYYSIYDVIEVILLPFAGSSDSLEYLALPMVYVWRWERKKGFQLLGFKNKLKITCVTLNRQTRLNSDMSGWRNYCEIGRMK